MWRKRVREVCKGILGTQISRNDSRNTGFYFHTVTYDKFHQVGCFSYTKSIFIHQEYFHQKHYMYIINDDIIYRLTDDFHPCICTDIFSISEKYRVQKFHHPPLVVGTTPLPYVQSPPLPLVVCTNRLTPPYSLSRGLDLICNVTEYSINLR